MGSAQPVRLAVMWPVVAVPARGPDGGSGATATWLVDGDTLEGASQLAAGAPNPPGTTPAQAPPDPTAAAWLQRLEGDLATADVRALPYADPDVTALVGAGLGSDVTVATALGMSSSQAVLHGHASVDGPVAMPAGGSTDRRTIEALSAPTLSALRLHQVLLSDTYAPTVATHPWTSSAVGPLTGTPLTAVAADNTLTTELATPAAQQGGAVLARQRVLAEAAMIAEELPSVSRSVAVLPPSDWQPDARYLRATLAALRAASWVQLSTLADISTDAVDGPPRQQPSYPSSLRAMQLDSTQLAGIRQGQARLAALAGVLTAPLALQDLYGRALLRSGSAAWRALPAEGHAYVHTVVADLARMQASVHIVSSGAVTLAARSGRIPVTVTNGLDQPVTVRVRVTAVPAVRLSVTQPGTVTIPAHGTSTLDVDAKATTNGSVQLVTQLFTADGGPFGPPVTVAVQITGLGAVAQVVVVVALLLLAGALVVRVVRAVRRSSRPGSTASKRELVR
jgi:hypothetical protein